MLMTVAHTKGETIFEEGDFADRAFLIESGKVEVSVQDGFAQKPLAVLGKGAIFGEMGLITASPRSATVKATEDCQLITISKAEFESLRKSANPVLSELVVKLVERFRDSQEAFISGAKFTRHEKDDAGVGFTEIVRQRNLTEGVEANEMEPFLQPIVNMRSGALIGFEALARWRSDRNGLMQPMDFLPMAERTGLVRLIDYAIAKKTLLLMAARSPGYEGPSINLNFSAWHFRDNHIVNVLDELTRVTRFPASRIKVEITESMVMEDQDRASKIIDELNERGFTVALDDFGTGYSSMSVLLNFAIGILKIDRSLVVSLQHSERARSIMKAMIGLARDLDMELTIEGVEDQQTADSLLALDCEIAQGFHFARPGPASDILDEWLAA